MSQGAGLAPRLPGRPLVMLALLALPLAGCLIQPLEELGSLGLSLDVPGDAAGKPAAEAWDEQGRLHLDAFGKFVRVALRRPGDDYEQSSIAWPAADGTAAEDPSGLVDLELSAAPGDYRLEVLGYAVENGRVFAFREREGPPLSLIAGKLTEAAITTRLHGSGVLEVQLACRESMSPVPYIKASISLVDARARVVLPPKPVPGNPPNFSAVEFVGVPVGRPFQVRVVLQNELDQSVRVLEIFQPLLTVNDTGGRQVGLLKIPCFFGG
jgi:hypothetical protein